MMSSRVSRRLNRSGSIANPPDPSSLASKRSSIVAADRFPPVLNPDLGRRCNRGFDRPLQSNAVGDHPHPILERMKCHNTLKTQGKTISSKKGPEVFSTVVF